jgi:hyperosmotically inducible periplasmic protein
MKKYAAMLMGTLVLGAMTLSAASTSSKVEPDVANKIRKELVTLPFYNVFDNLAYQISDSGEVTLSGQVTRPTLRSSAENVVKRVSGVTSVVNNIEVLPLSPFDDRLRIGLYRAIYSQAGLDRYALGAIPGIHIIVKNGVTSSACPRPHMGRSS